MCDFDKEELEYLANKEIPKVREDIRFWMVRTQGGAFYNEFLKDNYVGFGWNYIDSITDLKSDVLSDEIKQIYGIKQGKRAINKCEMFISGIQTDDIILIPNKGLEELIIALAIEYYEDHSFTVDDEKAMLWKLKNEHSLLKQVKCPYIKRWKIKIIKTVKGNQLNYHLYKTLRNYSGIDDVDEHAIYILGLIFCSFFYKNNLHIILNIKQKSDIGLSDLSGVLYGSSKYFSHFAQKKDIVAKVNICSEGDIFIMIKDIFEYVQQYGPTFINVFLTMFGTTYGIMKIKDVPAFLRELFALKENYKQEKINTEIKRQELREKELNNELKELEIKQKKIEIAELLDKQSINGTPTENESRLIVEASEPLEVMLNSIDEVDQEVISAIVERPSQ